MTWNTVESFDMPTILNLTQHTASSEQTRAGVYDLHEDDVKVLRDLLTFNDLPEEEDMKDRAAKVADMAKKVGLSTAMIGGAPFFMPYLIDALRSLEIEPVFAFSKREVTEDPETGRKVSVFKHLGFVPAM